MIIYGWKQGKVIETTWGGWVKTEFEGCYMYDPIDPQPWAQVTHGRWDVKYAEDVPKEFRTALLLLGIS